MEEHNYFYQIENLIAELDAVQTILDTIKQSLIAQHNGMQETASRVGYMHKVPWVGDDVTNTDTRESVKRRLTMCREMLLRIRKAVENGT